LNAENKEKGLHSDDDEEPWLLNTGGQKKFPPQVKIVNIIYATHIPKRERKRALRDVYAMEPVAPKFNPWSSCSITFDHRDHPTSILHGGLTALVLDPIIDGFHLTRVLMDGGSSLNLLYQDTVRKMGINPSRIKPTKTTRRCQNRQISGRGSRTVRLGRWQQETRDTMFLPRFGPSRWR